ncbi:hypothetical protein F0L74_21320 [Chitinophaga agrisoli]|uniref:Uncharacterized protein n=1 Tax=Chitinophaga agrisoli TaxID=2607653 RepID=A0A5B2VJA6_9BACT|nr:hypothetical protein [Chitinophaga agrisoli]KAA2238758.1 hypothetical protein F0L74_21320 [Chitinophaga agrisoli]
MSTRFKKIIPILLVFYLCVIIFTDISLTGFWTDIICFSLLFTLTEVFLFRRGDGSRRSITLRRFIGVAVAGALVFFVFQFTNPFMIDTFKLRSFYFQNVDGRLFNAYFKPVGSYSGGYGNFWITETPAYFPFVEWEVYYNRTVDWDFDDDNFDGQPVDNYEVVRSYIRSEVINKKDE